MTDVYLDGDISRDRVHDVYMYGTFAGSFIHLLERERESIALHCIALKLVELVGILVCL